LVGNRCLALRFEGAVVVWSGLGPAVAAAAGV